MCRSKSSWQNNMEKLAELLNGLHLSSRSERVKSMAEV